jgi:hypothetical protein
MPYETTKSHCLSVIAAHFMFSVTAQESYKNDRLEKLWETSSRT